MTSIRKMVYNKLILIADRVFFTKAPTGTEFPFVVFSYPYEGRAYKQQVEKMLQIRVYDHEKDGYNVSSEIESVTDAIEAAFDYQTAEHEASSAWFRKIGRTELPFPVDEEVWGRELLFEMRNYIGE